MRTVEDIRATRVLRLSHAELDTEIRRMEHRIAQCIYDVRGYVSADENAWLDLLRYEYDRRHGQNHGLYFRGE